MIRDIEKFFADRNSSWMIQDGGRRLLPSDGLVIKATSIRVSQG